MKLVSSDWSHWSTFFLAAQFMINQRLTSRHKSMPFELFLGRTVNLPSDYSNMESNPISEADHLAQIAKLHSVVWPAALNTPDLYNQIVSVAHNSSVSLVEFKPGDTIMLCYSATTSKMDLKYLGPFFIKCRTKSGAYILVDVTGNELKDFLPDKIDMESQASPDGSDNVISESNDDDDNSSKSYKVSKVLDHHGPINY
ncbi:hypothetical protein QOT17_012564 [Balamuthia mandrillaris]